MNTEPYWSNSTARSATRFARGAALTVIAVSTSLFVLLSPLGHAGAGPSADEAYLDALQGPWIMKGMLGGKPVTYRASGERVLKGSWLKLRMVDGLEPPQYQADVFIGYDAKDRDYVVHWLDQFGAAGARVVATGKRDGPRLVVTFPYAEGAFRDSFTRNAAKDTWTLLLESQRQSGEWSTFATYRLTRPSKR